MVDDEGDDFLGDYDPDINHFNELYPGLNSELSCRYYDVRAFKDAKHSDEPDNQLSIFHLNSQSLCSKFDQIIGDL